MAITRRTDLLLLAGPGSGIAAYLTGYLLTYAIVAPGIGDSTLRRVIDALEGTAPTLDLVGWVFYNAHFVDVVFRDVPILGTRRLHVVGGDGFTPLLYLLAPVLLVLAGGALAVRDGTTNRIRAATVGGMSLLGHPESDRGRDPLRGHRPRSHRWSRDAHRHRPRRRPLPHRVRRPGRRPGIDRRRARLRARNIWLATDE